MAQTWQAQHRTDSLKDGIQLHNICEMTRCEQWTDLHCCTFNFNDFYERLSFYHDLPCQSWSFLHKFCIIIACVMSTR